MMTDQQMQYWLILNINIKLVYKTIVYRVK